MEFNIVFKKDIVEAMEDAFQKLCELVIRCRTEKEVAALSGAVGGNFVQSSLLCSASSNCVQLPVLHECFKGHLSQMAIKCSNGVQTGRSSTNLHGGAVTVTTVLNDS